MRPLRVAVVMPDDFSLWQPRRGLLSHLVAAGFEVHAVSAPGPYVERICSLGVEHVPIAVTRSFDLLADLRLVRDLYRVFRAGHYDIVHCLNTKMNIYGTIAARLARVPVVLFNVDGLGQAFGESSGPARTLLRRTVSLLYFLASHWADRVRFMNADDLEFFVRGRLISPKKAVLIRGEGVDVDEYRRDRVSPERVSTVRRELGIGSQDVVVAMVARMIWPKGVREFVDAATVVRAREPRAVFLLVGGIEPGSEAVPREYLASLPGPGVRWVGFWQELPEIFALADVVVLPSYLREGVPNTLIEAMAMECPLVTTDNAGCREVVDEGRNGYLVAPRDVPSLADAILTLVRDPERRARFAKESRRVVLERFDQRRMFGRILAELYRTLPAERALPPRREA